MRGGRRWENEASWVERALSARPEIEGLGGTRTSLKWEWRWSVLDPSAWGLRMRGGWVKVKVLVVQLCPTLCDPMDCSLPGSSVHGISQARILEWAAIPFLQGMFPAQESNPGLAHCR